MPSSAARPTTTRADSATAQPYSRGYATSRPETVQSLERDSWARRERARRSREFSSAQRSQSYSRPLRCGGGRRR
jgi:hypothetical protein